MRDRAADRQHQDILDTERTPAELVACYRAELVRLYGEDHSEVRELTYRHGWYYINWGSGSWPNIKAYRGRQVLEVLSKFAPVSHAE